MENEKVEVGDEPFTLESIIPQKAILTLGGKDYVLRKVTLADEAWLKAQGNVEQMFKEENAEFFAKMAYRLLEDKTDFPGETRKGVDDDGFPIEIRVTGPQKILEKLSGPTQKYDLLKALLQTVGISRPLFDKIVEEQLKKNGLSLEESKSLVAELTGQKSST